MEMINISLLVLRGEGRLCLPRKYTSFYRIKLDIGTRNSVFVFLCFCAFVLFYSILFFSFSPKFA